MSLFASVSRETVIVDATAQVNNLDCGDQDSVGVFQQRPSKGWGTVAQIMNVRYSTKCVLIRLGCRVR